MKWLLDVNVLVAIAHQGHADHQRVLLWYLSLLRKKVRLATCAITEIGFVRVSVQIGLEGTVPDAVTTLQGLKASSRIPFDFLTDALGADQLPTYVTGAKQVTDGHLLQLAQEHGWKLATLDKNIRGAYLIPPVK
jgi:predicted nucleic acid-binding protein